MPQWRRSTFFPCRNPPHATGRAGTPGRRHSSRNNESRSRAILRWRCGRNPHPVAQARRGPRGDAPSIASGPSIAIETAMARARNTAQGEFPWPPSAPSKRPARTSSPAKSSPSRSRPRTSASSPRPTARARTAPATGSTAARVEVGRRLVQALQRGPRLSGPQARRSELHRPDLRQSLRRRGWRGLQPDLVPPQRAPGRLTPRIKAPAERPGPLFVADRISSARRRPRTEITESRRQGFQVALRQRTTKIAVVLARVSGPMGGDHA